VLYSFPHRLGAARICYTAWQQVNGLAEAGADVLVFPGSLSRPVREAVRVRPTLAWGAVRVPYKLLGSRALDLHDRMVARRLPRLAGEIDIVHTWPQGALHTLECAARLGIPTVLERPGAHTRFVFETVRQECRRLGVELPPNHEYVYSTRSLQREEAEFELADYLLCPSEFVVWTHRINGVPQEKLVRHTYGFDERVYYPGPSTNEDHGLRVLFVGLCAVAKGLHFALEAWLKSPASETGTLRIAGTFLPSYQEKLAPMLAHPSIRVLGHRSDVPELMRKGDILVLPSLAEGFGLVIAEAMASGCVPLASDGCTEICRHMQTGLVHRAGDVKTLSDQITMLHEDHTLLAKLRAECLRRAPGLTWTVAGERLLDVYREVLTAKVRPWYAPAPAGACRPEVLAPPGTRTLR
jgi:D-inositol-3-phosphate glycosyltransferase